MARIQDGYVGSISSGQLKRKAEHSNFEESTEELKPLTEEEKKAKLVS